MDDADELWDGVEKVDDLRDEEEENSFGEVP